MAIVPFFLRGRGLLEGLMLANELFDFVERSAEFFDGAAAEVSFLNGEPRLSHGSIASELIHLQDQLEMLPSLLPLVHEEGPSGGKNVGIGMKGLEGYRISMMARWNNDAGFQSIYNLVKIYSHQFLVVLG